MNDAPRIRHYAGKINATGKISALCSTPPRAINMKVATWTLQKSAVTCKKCKALLDGAK